jgi:hypothetical protein
MDNIVYYPDLGRERNWAKAIKFRPIEQLGLAYHAK